MQQPDQAHRDVRDFVSGPLDRSAHFGAWREIDPEIVAGLAPDHVALARELVKPPYSISFINSHSVEITPSPLPKRRVEQVGWGHGRALKDSVLVSREFSICQPTLFIGQDGAHQLVGFHHHLPGKSAQVEMEQLIADFPAGQWTLSAYVLYASAHFAGGGWPSATAAMGANLTDLLRMQNVLDDRIHLIEIPLPNDGQTCSLVFDTILSRESVGVDVLSIWSYPPALSLYPKHQPDILRPTCNFLATIHDGQIHIQ